MNKEILRQLMIKKRRSLNTATCALASHTICERIRQLPAFMCASHIMLYSPIQNEVDLVELLTPLVVGQTFYFPKIINDRIFPVAVSSVHELGIGKFGVAEPMAVAELQELFLDLIFVPGIVFSKDLYRIGFGKGYYDRFLVSMHATKIGVAYDFQVKKRVPIEAHDVQLNGIITDKQWIVG